MKKTMWWNLLAVIAFVGIITGFFDAAIRENPWLLLLNTGVQGALAYGFYKHSHIAYRVGILLTILSGLSLCLSLYTWIQKQESVSPGDVLSMFALQIILVLIPAYALYQVSKEQRVGKKKAS